VLTYAALQSFGILLAGAQAPRPAFDADRSSRMGNISGRQFSSDRLAATLTSFVNRDVRNQTKLDGLYDLDLVVLRLPRDRLTLPAVF
jgi:hypothetical protein